MSNYQKKFSFSQRKIEADRIKEKYPDRVPIICEKANMCSDKAINNLDKRKYLVPNDLTMAGFMFVIRRRLSLPPNISIFLSKNQTSLNQT